VSVCWLRQADGTLISQILNPVADGPCSFKRRAAGVSVVRLRFVGDDETGEEAEPACADLIHAIPVNGRWLKTWWDTDIEIAWWRGSPEYTAATIPEEAPTWAGPVVAGSLTPEGFIELEAWSQEAYVVRSTVGDTLINYLITGGVGDYRFSSDTSLASWTLDDDVTASTTNSGAMWLDDTYSALVEADGPRDGIYAGALVPDSDNGNYATATVAVLVPTGTALWAVSGDTAQVVGSLSSFIDGDPEQTWDLVLPDGWEFDRFYPISVQVRQPAGPDVSFTLTLYGGNGGSIRFGRPMFTRPANVGSPADEDISKVPEAIAEDIVERTPPITSYDVTAIGIDLVEAFRYFFPDHEDYTSVLGDWDKFGEWWVVEGVFYWAPVRGVLVDTVTLSTSEDLAGWGIEVDASGASNRYYGQIRPEGGAAYEIAAGTGTPNRLVSVEQLPNGMGPGDAPEYADAALAQKVPVIRLTGMPVNYTGLPGDDLADYMPGNWMAVEVEPLGLTGGDALLPTVDEVTWHPITDVVDPKWVIGGTAHQDPMAIMAAALQAAARRGRVYRPLPSKPPFGRLLSIPSETQASPGGGTHQTTETIDLADYSYVVTSTYSYTGSTGVSHIAAGVAVNGTEFDRKEQVDRGANTVVTCVTKVRGPCTIRGLGMLINRTSNAASVTLTLSAQLDGE